MRVFFKDFYLFIFRDRGRQGEREGEKHQCVVASRTPAGDLAHNPGMCPDWKSNQQTFASQASTHSTEPHQPGLTNEGVFMKNHREETGKHNYHILLCIMRTHILVCIIHGIIILVIIPMIRNHYINV